MRKFSKKMLLLIGVLYLSSSIDSNAGMSDPVTIGNHTYICSTNGAFSYNPNQSGMKRFTYLIVKSHHADLGGGQYLHVTKCESPGTNYCKVQESKAKPLYTDQGILVYTADYEEEFIDFAESFAGDRIAEGENSGKESFNEIKGKFKIYRSVSWNMDENNKAIKIETNIVTTETVED